MLVLKVLFQAATKSMHNINTTLLRLLSVETTQVIGRRSLNTLVSILIFRNVSLDYRENFRSGLICNSGKMDFCVKYLGKSRPYLGKVSSTCPRYFWKVSWRY